MLNGARAYALAAMLLGAPLDVWMGTAARAEETQTARVEEEDARPESGGGAARVEEIVVWGSPLTPFRVDAELAPLAETNTALLLRRIAGASVNFNGTLAGIAQYRGMSGERVNIDLDGMAVGNACSNHMDAPLHYLPRTFVDRIEVERGIASVSSGMETIGGTVVARSRSGEFGSDDALEGSGQLVLAGQSVDRGYAASGDFAVANERHRLRAAASREQGDARRFPGGRIRATRYERNAFDLGYGLRRGEASWSVDYRRNDTGLTGTPALPMDDVFSDANLLRSSFSGQRGAALLSAELYWNGIDHLMSNYRMRPVGSMRRDSRSDAQTLGWRVEAERELAGGEARAGVDGRLFDYDARVRNPDDAAFFVRTFDDVERDRYGVYAEWERGDLGPWALELGLRFTRVTMHADRVDASMAMMAPALATLRDRFNAAERTLRDDHLDATGVVTFALSDALRIEAGAARKMRSPTHQERFLWLPIEASGGLSDGNVYVGDLRLDPETAWQAELGLDWRSQRLQLAPRAFYHHVENYIQGVPSTDPAVLMVGAMNGDPTPLSFANVGARLYGVDVEWAATISPRWQLQGILSWVRGERRDVDDDLFRIAPFNARVDLSYQREQWSVTLEAEAAAAQDHVSLTNGETRSSGYGVVNLYGQYVWRDSGFRLTAGVENLFDATYRPHLNGINRVTQSDVAVGDRLPGDGVNGFVQLGWQF